MTEAADAARRVAAHARYAEPGGTREVMADDLLVLLPVLDAVARGAEGGRVEWWRVGLTAARDAIMAAQLPEGEIGNALARAALALADAEAAARREAGWRAYERARDDLEDALERSERKPDDLVEARAALDAAVRGMGEDHA